MKIRDGFRVVGRNSSDGNLHSWYFPTLAFANAFGKQMCEDTGGEYEVLKPIGSWERKSPPVEFIKATK